MINPQSSEVAQRNMYLRSAPYFSPRTATANWSIKGLPFGLQPFVDKQPNIIEPSLWHDMKETIRLETDKPAGSVVASFQLENTPSIAGRAVYFAMEAKMGSHRARENVMSSCMYNVSRGMYIMSCNLCNFCRQQQHLRYRKML